MRGPSSGYEGRWALVTGGSRGIGRQCVLALADRGCNVAFSYVSDAQAAEAVAEQVRALGVESQALCLDIADPDQTRQIVGALLERLGRLDILINNAGTTRDNLLATMSDEDLQRVIAVNLLGPMYVTRAVVRTMMTRREGWIVNLSSVAARTPGKGQSNYAASKGGIEAFTVAMAVELAPKGVMVNAVAPGVIATPMSAEIRQQAEDAVLNRLLVKRYGQPEEVAEAVLFLASPRNRYITGRVLAIDGGLKLA